MAVALVEQTTYDRAGIKAALVAAWEPHGGFGQLLAGKQRILLKPNFVVPEAAAGAATTHPEVYLAVAELLLELGKEVAIGESPAFGSSERAVARHQATDACQRLGIEVFTFRQPVASEGVPDDRAYESLSIAGELAKFDALINLPKLKVHQQFLFTGATKNLYGCVVGKRKVFRHNVCSNDRVRFGRMIVATARSCQPVLHIGDGITAMHVKGPRGGKPFPLHRLIVSNSFLEHDWVMAKVIGLNPVETPLFQALPAEERERVASACQEVLADPLAVPPEGFEQSYLVPMSFAPHQLARSAWRSLKFRLGRM